jgi:hypothetical protein
MALTKEQLLIEYGRCMKSTEYALRTYLQTFDNTVSTFVPLELFPDQISLLEDYEKFNENIALKYRQAGVTTVTAAWISKKIAFANKKRPEKILIIANKLDTAIEMANKVRSFTQQWPKWVGIDFSKEKDSQRHYKLNNGCEVKAVATSKDALRGYTPTILIFDEAAYIEADGDFWAACMASLSTGGKVIVISTPNGFDPIYYEIYDQALRNMNEFKISEMYWFKDPRYTRDLKLIKVEDLIHYYLNRDEYKVVETIDYTNTDFKNRNYDEIKSKISDGYKPTSSWFEGMVKKLKFDRRKVSQELECNFLGSGDNVFDSKLLQEIHRDILREPENKLMGGSLWMWKEPVEGHKYIMGMDVSRGDSEDFTSIIIIDFDEREQVFEYLGKIPPDVAAEIAYKWGMMYNAFIVIDITGGMGVASSRKLQEMGYKNLYVDGLDTSNPWKYTPKQLDKIPGINFNNKRVQIISAFEEALRHGFKIYSHRLFNEMNTYIYINGRPDHQKGHHDDLIMGISIAIYVGENSFTKLQKVTEQTKAMLSSWQVNNNEEATKQISFNPIMPSGPNTRNQTYGNEPTRKDYENYGWLFGAKRSIY